MPGNAKVWRDVSVVPPAKPGFLNLTRYGAVDALGAQVDLGPLMISSRAFKAVQTRAAPSPQATLLDGGHLWAGMIYGHFGHFITETLPRLLALRADLDAQPTLRLLGFAPPGEITTTLAGMRWFLDRAGIDPARIDLVTEPALIAQLTVPPAPFTARYTYHPSVPQMIDRCGLSATKPSGERIFLSRGQLAAPASRITNIAQVEALFVAAGYTILHPETLPVPDQIARITAAAVLAGENGSALHWSLYSPHIQKVQSLGWSLALQQGICAVRGQTYQALRDPLFGRFRTRRQSVHPKHISPYLAESALRNL